MPVARSSVFSVGMPQTAVLKTPLCRRSSRVGEGDPAGRRSGHPVELGRHVLAEVLGHEVPDEREVLDQVAVAVDDGMIDLRADLPDLVTRQVVHVHGISDEETRP